MKIESSINNLERMSLTNHKTSFKMSLNFVKKKKNQHNPNNTRPITHPISDLIS